MLKKFINPFVRKRHPWRTVKFDELAEIYISISIRSLGFGIIGIFVPIYLYQQGVSIQSIFWFFSWIFILRIPFSFASALIVGRIGPKHSMALSTLLFIFFLAILLSYESVGWPLIVIAASFTVSNGLYFIACNTDFSKIKHSKHGGKELGWLYIFERFGGALGPFVGGLIATFVSPDFTLVAAIAILVGSLIPLFLTNEPVKLHQNIKFKGFPWRRHVRDSVSLASLHLDNVASAAAWPLLIAVTVFADGAYAKIGGLVAGSMLLSIVVARLSGKYIDSRKGLTMLRIGAPLNALLHITRTFASASPPAAALISTVNEPLTISYRMPIIKGYYDAADSEEGYRIVYISLTEMTSAAAKAVYFLSLYFLSYWFDPILMLRFSFVVIGILSLGVLLQKFPALKKT